MQGVKPDYVGLLDKEFLSMLMWLENDYNGSVYVMDVDFDSGGVTFYGDQVKVIACRQRLDIMLCEAVQKMRDCFDYEIV